MSLGKNIQTIRKQRGLTQADLAVKTGIARGSLAQYEAGTRNPKIETLDKIAHALNVEVWDLYGETIWQQTARALRNTNTLPEVTAGYIQNIANNALRSSEKKSKIKPSPLSTGESTSNEQLLLLQEYFLSLNSIGREKALERLRELTEIPRYTSAPSDGTTNEPTAPRSPAGGNFPSQD